MEGLDITTKQNVEKWLEGPYDIESKNSIKTLIDQNDVEALTDAFYKELEFGTGGLRGIIGVGSNRVNKYTLGAATQGFSNFIKTSGADHPSVAIAHDCRNFSYEFAKATADIFSANGIKVYFFGGLRPTPELSFAIRHLGCVGGVMITASHNPKEYNGYKAYGADGGQLVSPVDEQIIAEVRKIESVSDINFKSNPALIEVIGDEIDEAFFEAILNVCKEKQAVKNQRDLKIVFSPIHGTGAVSVPPILKRMGFKNVSVVSEQMIVSGDFPTVVYPNPEEHEALSMALEQAKAIDGDLVMGTDPDADRVGIAVKDLDNQFVLLNGNQTGSLIIKYMLDQWEVAGKLDGRQYITKTIVTSYIMDKIATSKGVKCYNTLTGFKYIGALMTQLEEEATFIAGGEESYGFLIGEHARDKDAVVSCAIIAEMTAFYKDQGKSLYEALIDLHLEYGLYQEQLISIKKQGKTGAEAIKAMMSELRSVPPHALGGSKVVKINDYLSGESHDLIFGKANPIDLPASNVLQFFTEDGSIISARPSGTEPKIKFYCSVNTTLPDRSKYKATVNQLNEKIDAIMEEIV